MPVLGFVGAAPSHEKSRAACQPAGRLRSVRQIGPYRVESLRVDYWAIAHCRASAGLSVHFCAIKIIDRLPLNSPLCGIPQMGDICEPCRHRARSTKNSVDDCASDDLRLKTPFVNIRGEPLTKNILRTTSCRAAMLAAITAVTAVVGVATPAGADTLQQYLLNRDEILRGTVLGLYSPMDEIAKFVLADVAFAAQQKAAGVSAVGGARWSMAHRRPLSWIQATRRLSILNGSARIRCWLPRARWSPKSIIT